MANTILNFHFDYLNPSLRSSIKVLPHHDFFEKQVMLDDPRNIGSFQLEQCLHKCIELRKRKELEISLLQQPIRNWSGDSIEKLGTMRLMTQV